MRNTVTVFSIGSDVVLGLCVGHMPKAGYWFYEWRTINKNNKLLTQQRNTCVSIHTIYVRALSDRVSFAFGDAAFQQLALTG